MVIYIYNVVEGRVKPVKITGPRRSGRGGPECVFHTFLLFLLVSGVISDFSWRTVLAASDHLAYDVCIRSLFFPSLWGPKKLFNRVQNPFSSVLYIYLCRITIYSHLTWSPYHVQVLWTSSTLYKAILCSTISPTNNFLHFATTVYEDWCVFCSYQNLFSNAFVIRDVTYKKSRPTVRVMKVGVTMGVCVWLGWILHYEELSNLYSSVEFQEVLFQALKV